jgi:hypothetical protein
MLYGIPQAACRAVLGATILVTTARSLEIVAEAARRIAGYAPAQKSQAQKPQDKGTDSSVWSYIDLTTAYSFSKKEWTCLGISGLMNIATGAAALFATHRYYPDVFASASGFVRNVVGI